MFHHKKIYSNKHLLKKGFFQFMQYFNLTLMKGNKVVKIKEELTYSNLFISVFRQRNWSFLSTINSIGSYSSTTRCFLNVVLYSGSNEGIIEKVSINFIFIFKPYYISIFEI